jgi:hypothetical protein
VNVTIAPSSLISRNPSLGIAAVSDGFMTCVRRRGG